MEKFIDFDEIKEKFPIDPIQYRRYSRQVQDLMGGVKLAELRRAKKMTQIQMAKKLKIDQSNVSRIERGAFSKVELRTLRRYVEAMGGELEIRIRINDSSQQLIDSEYEKKWARKLARESESLPVEKSVARRAKRKSPRRASVAKSRGRSKARKRVH
ncbi:MAG: helix-turn-helix domain-containing protein [Actinobacteria bacterium]|nr:helix-turn-helix domain-containing protein [Actinomycetota bacterium]